MAKIKFNLNFGGEQIRTHTLVQNIVDRPDDLHYIYDQLDLSR